MLILLLLLPLYLSAVEQEPPWLIYYNDQAPIEAFAPYNPIILQSARHPPLAPLLEQKKKLLGYVNIGEVSEEDPWFVEAKERGLLKQENPNWPGSFGVDLANPVWETLLLETIIPTLLHQGFTGIFLDQIDVALEAGMHLEAVRYIKKIREKFPKIQIMLNRGYQILHEVGSEIDYELIETLYTTYDFKNKTYLLRKEAEIQWQLGQIDAAKKEFPELLFFSLDYWDLNDQKMVDAIYEKEIAAGMRPYVSTIQLDTIPARLEGQNRFLPRHILTFWDSKVDLHIEDSLPHRLLEMPLNYLGFDLIYADVHDPLPDMSQRYDVCGILLCFQDKTAVKDPSKLIDWASRAIDAGKKVVILRNPGFLTDLKGRYTTEDVQNRLYEKIGFVNTQRFIEYPFGYTVVSQDQLTPFERNYPDPLPGFYVTKVSDKRAISHLSLAVDGSIESRSDLIITGPNGAYVSEFYANNYDPILYRTDPRGLGWYLDPFSFFQQVFAQEVVPIPDTTTLAGKRIFYATCDGDNWNGGTAIEEYRGQNKYCSEVILEKIIEPNRDMPISVSIVAATVDPNWVARKKSQEIARAYNKLPQVEAASHTYSHPFDWGFFKENGQAKELLLLGHYPDGSWQNSYLSWFRAKNQEKGYEAYSQNNWGYVVPRAYAKKPFNLNLEIEGSVSYLNQFISPNNPIKLLLWPGDGRPWETPLALCYKAKIAQLGGGFVRFDSEYPSNLFVFPLARKPGGWIQPYASCPAENSYTNGWSNRFYGYRYLKATLENTESPRRLKPIQLYFHSYSGEYQASIDAIAENIAYIQTQPVIPIRASRFCDIVQGFYSLKVEEVGPMQWKIHDRKGLETLRLDHAKSLEVDLAQSTGVVGWTREHGSLYVYLDKAEAVPTLSLGKSVTDLPYLIDSSWEIWDIRRKDSEVIFNTKGWGKLIMHWSIAGNIREFVMELPNDQEFTLRLK